MNLNWNKCTGDVWCKLSTVNLNHSHFDSMHGVYVIWHGGSNPATVYVGKGYIKDRLADHRNNAQIQEFKHLGLYVTWASVTSDSRDGVERYLTDNLSPKVSDTYTTAMPIQVNYPW